MNQALIRKAAWNRITWNCDRSDFLAWRPREDGVGIEVLVYNYAFLQLPSGDGLFYVADAPSLEAIGGGMSTEEYIESLKARIGELERELLSRTTPNRVQLVCENSLKREVIARLYDKKGLYFEGKGRTDAEAIGSLVCHIPEQFKAKFDIQVEFDELTS